MVCAAASARAVTSPTTMDAASDVLARPAMSGALHGEMGAGGSPLAGAPALVAPASGAGGRASGATIFYDGFEGGMSNWSVLPASGVPTWATSTYRAAAGSSSAYCVGSQIPAPGPYANNMNAQMIAGPFDLSAVSSATFQYKLYYNTEVDKDKVNAVVSIDNDMFYGGKYTGDSQGWVNGSIDLTNVYTLGHVCGKSQVWIVFFFVSDPAITYEGAYVDEVSITGSGGGGGGAVALSLSASPLTVPYNGSVTLEGALTDATSGALLPNRDVVWAWSQNDNLPREWFAGDTASSSTGSYSILIDNIMSRTYFALLFAGDGQYLAGQSNFVKVMARARLTPPAVPSRIRAGALITSWGTLMPPHPQNIGSHTRVFIERFLGGKWRALYDTYASLFRSTSSETKYGVPLRFKQAGKYRIQAVHQDIDHAKTTSSWRTFSAY